MEEIQKNNEQEEEEKHDTEKATIKLKDWLKDELENTNTMGDFDKLPSLQFVENQTVEFSISHEDIPFKTWNDPVNKVLKKIIPVTHEDIKKNLWLNVKNPLYKEILEKLNKGITHFKVLQTGTQSNTKYVLVEN